MYLDLKYNWRWKLNYIPSYYRGMSEEQQRDNKIVVDFKNGIYDEDIMLWFRQNIWNITKKDDFSWSVCFLPCSNEEEHQKRFGKLAEYLKKTTRVNICLSTFGFTDKREPSHREGKTDIDVMDIAVNVSDLRNKNIILIDDIITTGKTFERTADTAMRVGARSVQGLFLAKTIHPNLPKKAKQMSRRKIEDAIIQEEAEIMKTLSQLPSEVN